MTQDTFLSAYKSMALFDGSHAKAWLCKIASNKCLDWLKRAGRRTVPTEDEYFTALPSSDSPERDYLEQEVKERLYRCCCSLKEPYRQVALDYYYYEIEIGELVKKTGKPIKTLQTQIYRAKGMLRNLYEKEGLSHDK